MIQLNYFNIMMRKDRFLVNPRIRNYEEGITERILQILLHILNYIEPVVQRQYEIWVCTMH